MAVKSAVRTKVKLDPERIIAAGLELAARPGVSAISVRELGTMLGADPTAIYRHFRSKDDLMRSLLDHILGSALAEVDADAAWDDRLRQLTARTIDWFVRYPAIGVEAVVLTTHGPGELGAIELMLDAFTEAGLDEDQIVDHYALMASHNLSGATGVARARGETPAADADEGAWLDEALIVDPRKYPKIAKFAVQLGELRDIDLLLRGVEMIIESAKRTAASRPD
ncbi:TetR/AcrR family transcriptional regulator [Microbacterium lacticum]